MHAAGSGNAQNSQICIAAHTPEAELEPPVTAAMRASASPLPSRTVTDAAYRERQPEPMRRRLL